MKSKLALVAILATSLLAAAYAQVPLDVTQSGAYPAYPVFADRSCGHVTLTVEQDNTMVRAVTTCPGSGRGSKSRTWLYCTSISSPDGYTVIVGERVFITSWLFGSAAVACPAN